MAVKLSLFPLRSRAITLISFQRLTLPKVLGIEMQPSVSVKVFLLVFSHTGLIKINSFSLVASLPITIKRIFLPTWGAAKPTPSLRYIISIISSIICWVFVDNKLSRLISTECLRKISLGWVIIFSIIIADHSTFCLNCQLFQGYWNFCDQVVH